MQNIPGNIHVRAGIWPQIDFISAESLSRPRHSSNAAWTIESL